MVTKRFIVRTLLNYSQETEYSQPAFSASRAPGDASCYPRASAVCEARPGQLNARKEPRPGTTEETGLANNEAQPPRVRQPAYGSFVAPDHSWRTQHHGHKPEAMAVGKGGSLTRRGTNGFSLQSDQLIHRRHRQDLMVSYLSLFGGLALVCMALWSFIYSVLACFQTG
jgi:hypothetical protein